MRNSIWLILLSAVIFGGYALAASAQEVGCCDRCGCTHECHKVCRLVCEEKKVEVFCWGCKNEDFCVPGPSCRGEKHCDVVCDTCGDKQSADISVKPKKFVWYEWIPGTTAKAYTRTKLMRGVTSVKVPSHKWVLEDMCAACVAQCERPVIAPGAEVPPTPVVARNVIVLGPVAK